MVIVVGGISVLFAFWGIGDVFRGGSRSNVATVGGNWLFGGARLSGPEFQRLYNSRLQILSRQVRRPITAEQARMIGLDRQVLGQWVQDQALDQTAAAMRLGIPMADVIKHITDDPMFRGMTGQFDSQRFQAIINEIGFSEPGYIEDQRRETVRRQITSTLTSDIKPPTAALQAFNRYNNEQRDAEFVVLTAAQAGDIPAPSAEVLAKYFEPRKVQFRAPEYRKATILVLAPEAIAGTMEIAAADVKAFYDQNIARFSVPEKRQVQQILFPNKEEAQQAATRLKGGLSFDDLAKERKLTEKDIDLGMITKERIADQKVRETAFSLAAGQVSDPIDGAFGSTIVRVVKIEPGSSKPFAEVEADIKKALALERAKAEIRKQRDKIDEQQGGGTPLAEIAKSLNLPAQAIQAIDRSGRGPDGKQIELPKGVDVLGGIFSADVGIPNDPLQTQDGGLVWYDLVEVTPSRDRTLDEVKDKVEARWRDDEIITRLNAKAKEWLDKIKGGGTLADLAAAEKLKVEKTPWLKRRDASGPLSAGALAVLFQTPKGQAGTSDGKQLTERIVLVTTNVTIPTFDAAAPDTKQMTDGLRDALTNDLYAQYMARIQSDLGVSYDLNAAAQAIGADKNQQ